MASSSDDTYFRFRPKGTLFLPEYYEGFLQPRSGRTPFKIIDDPAIIEKKNQMRKALRDEHTRRIYNPYRWAAGIGGHPFDPAMQRYYSMTRVGWQYYRPGPRMTFSWLMMIIALPAIFFYYAETVERRQEVKQRSGLVAYKDRKNKSFT